MGPTIDEVNDDLGGHRKVKWQEGLPPMQMQREVDLVDLEQCKETIKATFEATLPTEAKARKAIPIATGCLDYFPLALAAVAELSRVGNEQHNPGKPLHWDRSKSTDEADALARHFLQRGTVDTDKVRHSTKVAWRALALLQKELEAAAT